MYSPFLDSKGNSLKISNIRYNHLSQLQDCEEGHQLEFKCKLEDNGKAQLAKEIASFANCEGGWLIVGIEDKSKNIEPIEKFDYSQKIGKIATRIFPIPEFETKFISLPEDNSRGVLLIYVHEGRNAPYICNGSVYVRSGSSKEPLKPADRGNIEYLTERSKAYQNELEQFFKRDYFFAYNDILHQKVTYPIATIYLKNISSKKEQWLNNYKNRDRIIEFVLDEFGLFEEIQYSMNSIIFIHKRIYPSTNSGTFVFELFYDWSCKIYLPLGGNNISELNDCKNRLIKMGIDEEIVDKFKMIDGSVCGNILFGGLHLFAKIAQRRKLKEKNYAFYLEFENAAENILYFPCELYYEYVDKYGLPFAQKEINKSSIIFFKEHPNIKFADLGITVVKDFLGATFGFRSDTFPDLWKGANKRYEQDD